MNIELEDDVSNFGLMIIFVILAVAILIYFNYDSKKLKSFPTETFKPEKIIIIRESDFKDNELTPDGKKRSVELIDKLKSISKTIDHVYTLSKKGNIMTALPTAFSFQSDLHVENTTKDLVKNLENQNVQGKVLLFISHFVDIQALLNDIIKNESKVLPDDYNFYIIKDNTLTIQKEY